ncbi:type IV toxin-antitoxin system AbiEi family antitoxin [Microvirga sp. 2MCAF35]|uniref:type IV toxin-antitoxin system AbiEi family antitoxin domain-containing protein n=1 Tax=Microvirga sp. 2MCAF35 TaxID=3232987 RepID=UPI003F9771E5
MLLALASRRISTLTIRHAARLLGDEGKARSAVRRLLRKGWLQRASGGHYVVLPPEWGAEKIEDYDVYVLASASVDEGYIGWWAAASRHGFTTQVPNMIHVATTRQTPPREIQGNPVRYVKLSPRKFFGWQEMESFGRKFRISTPEKTLVDCADRPDLCGGVTELVRIIARGTESIRSEILVEAAIQLGSVSTCQRLAYLLDLSAPSFLAGSVRKKLRSFIPSSARSVLGRDERGPKDIGYVPEWGLLVNAEETDLLAEVGSYSRGMGR